MRIATEEFEPDFSQSTADMAELARLSALGSFDLFVYLRLLSEAGLPTLACEVDRCAAKVAGRRVVRYQLGEPLRAILLALRARHVDEDEIKSRSGARRSPGGSGGRGAPTTPGGSGNSAAAAMALSVFRDKTCLARRSFMNRLMVEGATPILRASSVADHPVVSRASAT